MFFPSRCLHGIVHLPRDTQVCKGIKAGISPRVIVPDCLEQPDHALLYQIVIIRPEDIHGFCFFPNQILVLIHNIIRNVRISISQPVDQLLICKRRIYVWHTPLSLLITSAV